MEIWRVLVQEGICGRQNSKMALRFPPPDVHALCNFIQLSVGVTVNIMDLAL